MSDHQSKQTNRISLLSNYQSLIKFCYFISLILLAACGENKNESNPEEKKSSEEQSKTPDDQEKETVTDKKTILIFGDSITAGYGLDDTADAYPGILQDKIDSLGLNYTVVNSGLSGETTAGGKSRISWVLKQDVDIFILELGANDGLRGVALSETKSNLQSIIDRVSDKSPDTRIVLAGMQLPPNMGQDYTAEFRQLFADLANENSIEFIPFILKDVGGIEELNQNDGIHPNVEGHQIVAENVWEVLKPMIVN